MGIIIQMNVQYYLWPVYNCSSSDALTLGNPLRVLLKYFPLSKMNFCPFLSCHYKPLYSVIVILPLVRSLQPISRQYRTAYQRAICFQFQSQRFIHCPRVALYLFRVFSSFFLPGLPRLCLSSSILDQVVLGSLFLIMDLVKTVKHRSNIGPQDLDS